MLRPRIPFRQETFGGIAYDNAAESYCHLRPADYEVLQHLDRSNISEHADFSPALRSELDYLARNGLVHATTSPARMHRGKLQHENGDLLAAPTILVLYANLSCNERCQFCFVGNQVETARHDDVLDPARIPAFADTVANAGVFNVEVLGGEPFLYNSLDVLLDELAGRGLDLNLSTNGTVHDQRYLDAIIRNRVKLNIALHGPSRDIHDAITRSRTFDKAVDFIHLSQAAGIGVHVTTVLHPLNVDYVERTVDFLAGVGVKKMTVAYPHPFEYTVTNRALVPFEQYASLFRKAGETGHARGVHVQGNCHYNLLLDEYRTAFDTKNPLAKYLYGGKSGRSRLEMTPAGDLYASSAMFGKPEWKAGNVFADDFLDVWAQSPVLNRIRDRPLPKQCRECSHEAVCGGGVISPMLVQGRWEEPPSDCPLIRSGSS